MKPLRAAWEWFAFVLTLAVIASCQLVWAPVASVLWRSVSRRRGRLIGRRLISRAFRLIFRFTGFIGILRVDADALDALDPREPLILAANHPSVLDALILISRLERLSCIMKASLVGNVLLGPGARLAGYIRNDAPRRMLRQSATELRRGGQLIVFPEATRTVAAPVNAFTGGFASIAKLADVPIQTVFIETNTPFLSKGWPVLRKPRGCPMVFRVRLGERFEVPHDRAAFVRSLQGYFERELASAELGDLWARKPRRVDEPAGVAAATWQAPASHSATHW